MGYTYSDGAFHIEPFVYIQTPPAGSMFTSHRQAHFMIAQLEGGQLGDAHILLASTARRCSNHSHERYAGGWAYGFWR
jgi:hypothetical protein